MELLAPPYQGGVGGVDVSCYFMKLVLLWDGRPTIIKIVSYLILIP